MKLNQNQLNQTSSSVWLRFATTWLLVTWVLTAWMHSGGEPCHAQPPEALLPSGEIIPSPTRVVRVPPSPVDQINSAFSGNSGDPSLNTEIDAEGTSGNGVHSIDEVDANQTDPARSADDQPERWIEQLGSTEFALRERATARLRQAGLPAIPLLRETAANHPDVEVRMRAHDVAEGIVQGEAAGRIDAFLAGKEVSMDGWNIATKILGDGVRIRELYVDLIMRHADVARSLNGSSPDRGEALRSATARIQRGRFVERRVPTESDAIALLLLVNDRSVPINRVDEGALLMVLQTEASSLLFKDPQLVEPFRNLLAGWMTRDDVTNRQDKLWFAMTWDLQEIMPLIQGTLKQDNDPIALSIACQALARFATVESIQSLRPLLSDERPVSEQQYSTQRFAAATMVQAQVRDAAAAAIVLLSGKDLSDFEMNDDARHPKYGFVVPEIGFPVDDPKPRTKVIDRVRKELLKDRPDA